MLQKIIVLIVLVLGLTNLYGKNIVWDQRTGVQKIDNYLSHNNFFNNESKCIINETVGRHESAKIFGIYDYENHTFNPIELPFNIEDYEFNKDSLTFRVSNDGKKLLISNHKVGTEQKLYLYNIQEHEFELSIPVVDFDIFDLSLGTFSQDNNNFYIIDNSNTELIKIDLESNMISKDALDDNYIYELRANYYLKYNDDDATLYDYDNSSLESYDFNFSSVEVVSFSREHLCFISSNNSQSKELYNYLFVSNSLKKIDEIKFYDDFIKFKMNDDYIIVYKQNEALYYKYYFETQTKEELSDEYNYLDYFSSDFQYKKHYGKNSQFFIKVGAELFSECFIDQPPRGSWLYLIVDFDKYNLNSVPNASTNLNFELRLSKNETMLMSIAPSIFYEVNDVIVYDILNGNQIERKMIENVHCFAPDDENLIVSDHNQLLLNKIGSIDFSLYDEFDRPITDVQLEGEYLRIITDGTVIIYDYYNKENIIEFGSSISSVLRISNDEMQYYYQDTLFKYDLINKEYSEKQFVKGAELFSKSGKYFWKNFEVFNTESMNKILTIEEDDKLQYFNIEYINDQYLHYNSFTISAYGHINDKISFIFDLNTKHKKYLPFLENGFSTNVYSQKNEMFIVQDCEYSVNTVYAIQPDFVSVQEDQSPEKGGNIYPNPVMDHIYLSEHFLNNNIGQTNIYIYDLQGSLVKRFLRINTNKLNIADLPTGSYMMLIQKGNEIESEIFIKE